MAKGVPLEMQLRGIVVNALFTVHYGWARGALGNDDWGRSSRNETLLPEIGNYYPTVFCT
jgi:hypothetical protein